MTSAPADPHCETPAECAANALTHGLGLVLAVGAAAVLIVAASLQGDPLRITALSIFGATLITLYAVSSLYHASRRPATQRLLQKLDHMAIFLLIAGTYTPFMLVTFGGAWGWSLFAVVWGLALVGVVLKAMWAGRYRWLSTGVYLGMGWLVLIAAGRLQAAMSAAGLGWLIAGGIAYTAGVVFFLWRRLKFSHAIWHCFVLAGSACHVAAMWVDVLGA